MLVSYERRYAEALQAKTQLTRASVPSVSKEGELLKWDVYEEQAELCNRQEYREEP